MFWSRKLFRIIFSSTNFLSGFFLFVNNEHEPNRHTWAHSMGLMCFIIRFFTAMMVGGLAPPLLNEHVYVHHNYVQISR